LEILTFCCPPAMLRARPRGVFHSRARNRRRGQHRPAPPRRALSVVMPGLDPGIQEPRARSLPPWIAGSSPAMTECGAGPRPTPQPSPSGLTGGSMEPSRLPSHRMDAPVKPEHDGVLGTASPPSPSSCQGSSLASTTARPCGESNNSWMAGPRPAMTEFGGAALRILALT